MRSTANDISVPMSARAIEPEKGGFTGQLSFAEYEERYLGGDAAAVKAGVVAASLPLKALLNFNTDLLIGEISDADCSAEPTPAGCYEVSIAGLGRRDHCIAGWCGCWSCGDSNQASL